MVESGQIGYSNKTKRLLIGSLAQALYQISKLGSNRRKCALGYLRPACLEKAKKKNGGGRPKKLYNLGLGPHDNDLTTKLANLSRGHCTGWSSLLIWSRNIMRMVDLILAKRSGKHHSREEIEFIIKGITDKTIPDYQLSAWLMAVCWQGMHISEIVRLTDAMANSGEVLNLKSIGPIVGDKHSTGGVGDKTTLVFVPMLAALGIPMAKLSGRGLGHTGGTIDKLEAIPGFQTDLPIDKFISQVKEIGAAISGQTPQLAPADGKIYALRDVTGTVESIPLIAASVMSKKIAAGSNLIILDVKCGGGAFMESREGATELAQTMASVGESLGRPVSAVVTDMEQPLGLAVGHTLEVMEAIECLQGRGPKDLRELCLELGSHAVVKAGKANDSAGARALLEEVLANGKALDKFRQLIVAQGGDPNVIENPSLMPQAKYTLKVPVPGNGKKQWIHHVNGKQIAQACKLMGAGREKKGDPINMAVGIVLNGKIGSTFDGHSHCATIYADNEDQLCLVEEKVLQAITFSEVPVEEPQLILATVN
jgi:pyrimidine-nucleoside phosphorylase